MINFFNKIKKISSQLANQYHDKANIFLNTFDHRLAIKYYRKSIFFEPKINIKKHLIYNLFSTLICTDPKELSIDEYKNILKIYTKKLIKNKTRKINFNNKIKNKIHVGFACHFFSSIIAENYLWKLFDQIDKSKFEIYILSDDDKVLENKPSNPKLWDNFRLRNYFYDTSKMDVNQYVDFVQKKELDIIFECNGHTDFSRFEEFSYGLAKKQLLLFNINGPSGFNFIDFIPIRPDTETEEIEKLFTENFIQFDGISSAELIDQYPQVKNPPPFMKNNYVTFGYFGAMHKVTNAIFLFWTEILKKVPNSKLIIKNSAVSNDRVKKKIIEKFSNQNISKERILLMESTNWNEYLNYHNNIDISLSTFPHNGGSTFLDSLLMGVPILILNSNERLCSQIGKSALRLMNLENLCIKNENEYVYKYVNLSKNTKFLQQFRENSRQIIIESNWFNQNNKNLFEKFLLNIIYEN